jgi:hypothetical protein
MSRLDNMKHFILPFILIFSVLLNTPLYAEDISQSYRFEHSDLHLALSHEPPLPPIPKTNALRASVSSSHHNSSHLASQQYFKDSQYMRSIDWDEIQAICHNKRPEQLFNDFTYYANPYYLHLIRQQQGYEDFILALHEKYTGNEKHKHKYRKSLCCIKGFYPYQFLKLIDAEHDCIKTIRQERERQKKMELRKKLEHAKNFCLQINSPSDYHNFINHCEQESKNAQTFGNQTVKTRFQKRIAAAQKALANPTIYDYSSQLKPYPVWKDPDAAVFNNRIGTVLDQQLHEELCDTRLRMHELPLNKSTMDYDQLYIPIINRCTALAKQEKNLDVAFGLSDFSVAVVRILSQAAKILDEVRCGVDEGLKMVAQTAISPRYWAELVTAVPCFIVNVLPTLLTHSPKLLAQGVVFAANQQSLWDGLEQAYILGDHELLERRCAKFAQENQRNLKPIAERLQHLASMSWEDLGKYGTYYGGRLVLDVIACHAFTLAASAAGRELTSSIAHLLEASTAPERLVEVAGIGKVAVEEGIETGHKVADLVCKKSTNNSMPEILSQIIDQDLTIMYKKIALGKGSTGRRIPKNLNEQLAMKQVLSNPLESAIEIRAITMTDPRWLSKDGWIKIAKNVNGIEIHYVYNTKINVFDDFKFK